MLVFQQQTQIRLKLLKLQSKETTQLSELDSDTAEILKLSDRDLKITMINMLRALMEKSG